MNDQSIEFCLVATTHIVNKPDLKNMSKNKKKKLKKKEKQKQKQLELTQQQIQVTDQRENEKKVFTCFRMLKNKNKIY